MLEEGTEVAVAVATSGSWRRVRASSETPWEPTSSAVCSFFFLLSFPCVVKVKRVKACTSRSHTFVRARNSSACLISFLLSLFFFFFFQDSLHQKSIHYWLLTLSTRFFLIHFYFLFLSEIEITWEMYMYKYKICRS